MEARIEKPSKNVTEDWFYLIFHKYHLLGTKLFPNIWSIIAIFGLIGNIIVFIIYKQRVFKKQSRRVYQSCLSITYLIFFLLLVCQIITIEYYHICNLILETILKYSLSITIHFSSWILVANSIDDLYCTIIKLKFKNIYKRFKPMFVLPVMLLTISLIDVLVIYFTINESKPCKPIELHQSVNIINILLITIFPFILMFISTIIKLINICKRNSRVLNLTAQNMVRRRLRNIKYAIRIILIDIIFLIGTLPATLSAILISHALTLNKNFTGNFTTQNLNILADSNSFYIFHKLSVTFDYLFRASLLTVSLMTNKIFRKEFFRVFSSLKENIQEKILMIRLCFRPFLRRH